MSESTYLFHICKGCFTAVDYSGSCMRCRCTDRMVVRVPFLVLKNKLDQCMRSGVIQVSSPDDNPPDVSAPASAWHNQVGGNHYHGKGEIQPFEYAMRNSLNSLEFSVVKYLRKKGDKAERIEDLKKAADCLAKLIEWEEKDGQI